MNPGVQAVEIAAGRYYYDEELETFFPSVSTVASVTAVHSWDELLVKDALAYVGANGLASTQTVLQWSKQNGILALAAQRGTDLHAYFEHLAFGTPYQPRTPYARMKTYLAMAQEVWQWLTDSGYRLTQAEQLVRAEGCIGRIDGVLIGPDGERILVDWKSNHGKYFNYKVQLAGYLSADQTFNEEHGWEPFTAGKAWIIGLDRLTGVQVTEVKKGDKELRAVWDAALTIQYGAILPQIYDDLNIKRLRG